ncbi:hypothetical protein KIN20_033230 [Parelaphostrongylus tenuis]|uniref:Uncharacterized protein n=1 Tax=Parelaphostrongylus tenuis TaxID=148309 RepID=A0AAD5WI86_PARTN|nr:hypothetical protein KIN20_033230 [Parelaphostrongylus tenuis]
MIVKVADFRAITQVWTSKCGITGEVSSLENTQDLTDSSAQRRIHQASLICGNLQLQVVCPIEQRELLRENVHGVSIGNADDDDRGDVFF